MAQAKASVTIYLEGLDRRKTLAKLRLLVRSPEHTMYQMALLIVADGQRAFREQRLGDIKWPARYASRGQPHVNTAGVVADFLAGRARPKPIRFVDRPAGIDTAQTLRNLTPGRTISIRGHTIYLWAPTEQAKKMQSRNDNDRTSVQMITKGVKELMAAWMKSSRRRVKKAKVRGDKLGNEDVAAKRLGFLFRRDKLRTQAAWRPFFGITSQTARKLVRIAAGHYLPPGVQGKVSS